MLLPTEENLVSIYNLHSESRLEHFQTFQPDNHCSDVTNSTKQKLLKSTK